MQVLRWFQKSKDPYAQILAIQNDELCLQAHGNSTGGYVKYDCTLTATDSYLFYGDRAVSKALPLRQLCILSFQRHQFLSLLQTSDTDTSK